MWQLPFKKALEQTKGGYYGDLTDEQSQVLDNFKQWITAEQLDTLSQWDDYDYLRFCRARKFKLPDIKTMFQKFVAFRNENDIDTLIDRFSFPDLEKV